MADECSYYTSGLGLHLSEDFQESALALMEKQPAKFSCPTQVGIPKRGIA
jgi:hypothetical protein